MKSLSILATAMGAVTSMAAEPGLAAKAVNEFGVELHQRLAKGEENLCVSPFSIQMALAMTFAGADGATREEMAKVLHFPPDDGIHGSFEAMRVALESVTTKTAERAKRAKQNGGPADPFTLKIANRLFGQASYQFKAPFVALLDQTYRAPLEELDFIKDAAKATKHINAWVEEQTQKRIQDLIPGGALDKETRLVLVNAIYMKAPWEDQFKAQATKPEPFFIKGGATKEVPTMIQKEKYGYAKRDGYTAVTIPYTGGEIHFLVLVPDEVQGLGAIEKQLSGAVLSECAKLPAREVVLHLPKFKLEPPTISLTEQLQAMGMKTAFNVPEGSANFERMAARSPTDYLYISDVFHKTFIALDEKGTEAAAATAVVMARATSAPVQTEKPVEVKVDRPFLFAIQHRASGACLFLGRVTDPR
jgi:serpin B